MDYLRLENICHSYGESRVLGNVNLGIEKGEFITLLGPSGCGKTTILKIISGLIEPTSGRVFLDGKDITDLRTEKRNMGIVFQNYALFPNMTVEQNVRYGLDVKKTGKNEAKEKVEYFLEMTDLLEYRGRHVDELSGGQQQRVAIARALSWDPSVLLLDEPLSNLDAALRMKLRDEIRVIQQKTGITTVFVTHDQHEAISVSDRIAVMNGGSILQFDTPKEIYNNPKDSFVRSFVGASTVVTEEEYRMLGGKKAFSVSPFVRPEQLEISDWKGTGVKGEVLDVVFTGAFYEYTVLFNGKEISVNRLNLGGYDMPEKGDTVELRLRNE
ncbi:MAG: ABC transporter ATP-binding protein [Clostridia bacterium]|nr:ABC transporter ATP-binding protein [Clostridia bacterium]